MSLSAFLDIPIKGGAIFKKGENLRNGAVDLEKEGGGV